VCSGANARWAQVTRMPEKSKALRGKRIQPLKETLSRLNIPLLAGFSPSETADVLEHGETLTVTRKGRLCTGGERAEHLFVVLRGRVKYSRLTADGNEIVLHLFTPGECFGFATLVPYPLDYLGTAEAMYASELIVWDRQQASYLSDRYPKIRTNALGLALQYLGRLSDRHCSLFEGAARHRIARTLIDVGRRSGGIHPEGIDVHITNEHLGSLSDVSRFTASRVLSHWNKAGVITKERETVRIHSPEALLSH
jgi:CRP/FNR family transcriptional regulator, nitrogen oxide reductase regulator